MRGKRGYAVRIGQPRGKMAHQQRVRALPLESGGAQRINCRGLIFPHAADDWAGLVRGEDTQGEAQQ